MKRHLPHAMPPAAAMALAMLLAAVVVAPTGARAAGTSLRVPASYRSWKLETPGRRTTVSQFHLPFTASFGIGNRADLVVSGAMGFSSVDPDSGPSLTLRGPTDVTAQAFVRTAGNRLLFHAGVNLPTGVRNLNAERLAVSQALAHPLLAFRVRQYGQGTDFSAGLAAALPLAPKVTFGLGAGHIFRGAYPLEKGQKDFEPSNETSISAGLNLGDKDEAGPTARLDAVYRLYGTDRQGGIDLFEPGNQTEFLVVARTGDQGPAAEITGRLVLQADDRFHSAGAIAEPQATRPGTYSRVSGVADAPLGSRLRAGVNLEWSGFSGSDLTGINIIGSRPVGLNGSVYGGGPQLRLAFGRSGVFALGGSYLLGKLDAGVKGPRTDLTGFVAFCSLVWRMGR